MTGSTDTGEERGRNTEAPAAAMPPGPAPARPDGVRELLYEGMRVRLRFEANGRALRDVLLDYFDGLREN